MYEAAGITDKLTVGIRDYAFEPPRMDLRRVSARLSRCSIGAALAPTHNGNRAMSFAVAEDCSGQPQPLGQPVEIGAIQL